MVYFDSITFPAAALGPENPLPDIKNVSYIHAGYEMTERVQEEEKKYIGKGMVPTMLPYTLQDGYDRERRSRRFQTAVVENDAIRAVFLPELGGRLWSLYDKKANQELLYVNSVFQAGNLGLRNAWFSGGVEFNVGIKGHSPLTCSPLHAVIDQTSHGQVLRLYEYERIRGVAYSISAWVNETDPTLFLRPRIENTRDESCHMYWWTNIAVPETAGTRVIVPTNDTFLCRYDEDHYVLDKASVPLHEGRDISYPSKIPASRDFFYKIPQKEHKWIASVNEEGLGLLQCSTQELFGRKLFVWGMGQGGRHWNEWLSEEGQTYVEIQAGVTRTQLEHIPMAGHSTWEWTEAYTLMQGDPAVLHGPYEGAIKQVTSYLLDRVGDPDALFFPPDQSVTETKSLSAASDWGALEEALRGEKISCSLPFPRSGGKESDPWWELLEKGSFPCPNPLTPPASYVSGKAWLDRLQALPRQNWFSLLHQGVILYTEYAYGREQLDRVREAFEASDRACPNPWAKRNLAMLYKNEYKTPEKVRDLLLAALRQKKDFLPLIKECAMQLTEDGGDEAYLALYDALPAALQENGRLRLLRAVALIHLDRLEEATAILNPDFVMADVKEGELSVSHYWFLLYRRLWAKQQSIPFDPADKALAEAADAAYPLPKALDFRMH